jgi:hypothetical protein
MPLRFNALVGEFFDPVAGLYVTSGYLSPGATTRLRVLTSRSAGASETARVRIGTVDATFEVRNAGGDPVPDAFDFVDQTGVALGVQVFSNDVTLRGLVGDTAAAATGCEISTDFSSFSTSVRVANGTRAILRMTSAATPGTTTTCTVDIGGVVDQFRVTTASRDSVPNAFDFIDQSGAAAGAQVISNEVPAWLVTRMLP